MRLRDEQLNGRELIELCPIPDRSALRSGSLLIGGRAQSRRAWMRTFALEEVRIDQGHNLSAQRLILFEVLGLEDLKPDLEIRVANQNDWILHVTVSSALQKPSLVRVFGMEARIQALDKVPGEMIIDPPAIVFAKDQPGLALRVPDDVLSIVAGAGEEEGPV